MKWRQGGPADVCWLYSTKLGSWRWSFHVFCNMLVVAGINSHTVFKLADNSAIYNVGDMLKLDNELVSGHRAKATSQPLLEEEVQAPGTCTLHALPYPCTSIAYIWLNWVPACCARQQTHYLCKINTTPTISIQSWGHNWLIFRGIRPKIPQGKTQLKKPFAREKIVSLGKPNKKQLTKKKPWTIKQKKNNDKQHH